MPITNQDIARLEAYLHTTFGNDSISLRQRPKANDSVEVLLNGEFIGIVYKDDEDSNDISFDFNMAILEEDLPKVAAS